jgi:hypothetical protein
MIVPGFDRYEAAFTFRTLSALISCRRVFTD